MSGLKYSRITLEKERRARREALAKIESIRRSVDEFRKKVESLLGTIPDGVKQSFQQEVDKVKSWMSEGLPAAEDSMDSSKLNHIAEVALRMEKAGKEALSVLIDIREVRREKRERELIQKLQKSDAETRALGAILAKWRPRQYEDVSAELDKLSQTIERGEFIAAEREMTLLHEVASRLGDETAALESLDNQRSVVLEALEKACGAMGWRGTRKERDANPEGPVLYEVNTFSAGKIVFRLFLDGIEVQSPITNKEDRCRKEFGAISEQLKRYGVITKFEHPGGSDEDPRKVQRGELDLPDEGMEAEQEGW